MTQADMAMPHEAEIEAILKRIADWSPAERLSLARRVRLLEKLPSAAKPTIDELVGAGRGDGPAPSDQDLARWKDEHLAEKYR